MQKHLSTDALIKVSRCNEALYHSNSTQSSLSRSLNQTPAFAGLTHKNFAIQGSYPKSGSSTEVPWHLYRIPALFMQFAAALIVITIISAGSGAFAGQVVIPPLFKANQYPGMSTPFYPGSNSNTGIINHPAYPGTVTNPGNTGGSGNPAYPGTVSNPGNSGNNGPAYPGAGGNNGYPGSSGGNSHTGPVYPGTPGYPGNSGNPGYPGYPTNPTPPVNPGAISDYNLYNYGHSKYAAGNFNSAFIYFDQLLKQYPGSQYADDAGFWRAKIRAEQKNHQQAILLFANFLRVWPASDYYAEALYNLAETEKAFGRVNYANRNHLFEAAGHFAGYQQRYPQSQKASEALFQAGECFEISGDYSSSRSYYYGVTQLYPYSAAAAKAREKLSGRY